MGVRTQPVRFLQPISAPACRLKRLCLVLVMLLAAMVALGPPAAAQPPVLSAAEIEYPPFSIVDADGRATGFSVELMRAALKAMNREVIFRTGVWSDVRGWLERGEIRALPLVGRTPEREAVFDFTFPYMSLHGAIVVRKDTVDIRGIGDLKGRGVAVMKGDNAEEFLRREERGIEIRTTATFEDALRELSEGLHDAVVVQRLVALRLIRDGGLTNLRVIERPIEDFKQDFCFAVREGDREMLALLNEGLSIVMADGTYRHLHARWFAALELPTHRRIVIGGDHNYPPFEYLDENGRPAGYNVELTRAIAKEIGLEIEIRLGPWADVREALARGDIDVLQGMFYSPERDLTFDFSPPHTVNQGVVVVRKDEGPPPAALSELAGKRLVVQRGDIMHDFLLENLPGALITAVDAQEDALRELVHGKHDCALVSMAVARYWIGKHGWDNLEVGTHRFLTSEYCYAVLKNQKALLAQFSDGLKILVDTGEYRRIHNKWLGFYQDPQNPLATIARYVAMGVAPLLGLLLVVFLWVWSLRKQVARRTDELRRSEALLDASQRIAGIGGWEWDAVRRRMFWTDETYRIHGLGLDDEEPKSAEFVERSTECYAPEDRPKILDAFRRCVEKGEPYEMECRFTSADGRNLWVRTAGRPVFSDGKVAGAFGHIQDITAFKSVQERIEHLNNVLRAIRDVNQLILRERDLDVLIRDGCRMLVENRGYASATIVLTGEEGLPVSWARAGIASDSEGLKNLLERGETPPCCGHIRAEEGLLLVKERDGICRTCPIVHDCADSLSLVVPLAHGDAAFGFIAAAVDKHLDVEDEECGLFTEMAGDLSYAIHSLRMEDARRAFERRSLSLEGQLLQAQKMESVGRLAGGVAHDFNNMLSVIMGCAELAMNKTGPDSPLYRDLKEILDAARRSADITRQLLAFARKQTINPKMLDLNETVESMLKMLRRLIGEDIDLVWHPSGGLWPVKMDPTQIDQILANLCVNARDAIDGVGKITIETGRAVLDDEYCAEHPGFIPGKFVMLAVSDNGCGMDRETLANIFDPFFTTKEIGTGTGLGLATVYGIVKQNNGFINVYSEPGKGTTFRIYLQRDRDAADGKGSEKESEVPLTHGSETVLLVEDEPMIMNMGKMMLERLGYRVLAADTPIKAMRLAEEHPGQIHLLMTDVVMPEMNGRELASQLHSLCPEVKILFMSGYTADVIAHHGVLENGVHFLQKPFSIKDLAAKLREALGGAADP